MIQATDRERSSRYLYRVHGRSPHRFRRRRIDRRLQSYPWLQKNNAHLGKKPASTTGHLSTHNTGKSGSGSTEAKVQQEGDDPDFSMRRCVFKIRVAAALLQIDASTSR
jgi:hypothetical protein